MNFVLRFVLSALAGFLLINFTPGREARDSVAVVLAAVLLSLVVSFVKPRSVVRSQPITLFTLGLLFTAVNFGLLQLCLRFIPGFELHGWWYGLVIAAAVTFVNFLTDRLVPATEN